jgi:hypothetical protein
MCDRKDFVKAAPMRLLSVEYIGLCPKNTIKGVLLLFTLFKSWAIKLYWSLPDMKFVSVEK